MKKQNEKTLMQEGWFKAKRKSDGVWVWIHPDDTSAAFTFIEAKQITAKAYPEKYAA